MLQAFSPDVTREMLIPTSAEMPRLDAHLASVLMEAKHLKGELGLQFQAYTESEQMRGRAPLGRVLLNMIARRFFLDQSRGANLTQQSLLEPEITQYTPEGLSSFVDRVEYVLKSIPPELQPSEMTRYTWLYSPMRKVRVMQRHIDKIRDSRVGSRCRTYDWLFGKLKTCINEMKEDQNEEAVRSSLQKRLKDKDKDKKPKAAAATTKSEGTQEESKGLPNPKAKAKPKATQPNPKEKGSGEKGKGKKDNKARVPVKERRQSRIPSQRLIRSHTKLVWIVCSGEKVRVTAEMHAHFSMTQPRRQRQSQTLHLRSHLPQPLGLLWPP